MARRFIISGILVALTFTVVAAQDEVPWLSLSRLSLTASSSYHFSPWKKYNESLRLAQDAIQYSSYYQGPKGSFEKILGDGSVELEVGYRLIEGLSINAIGGYTTTNSNNTFTNLNFDNMYPNGSPYTSENIINQSFKLNVREYGVGLRYDFEITSGIRVFGLASVNQASGIMNFDYEYAYSYVPQMSGAKYFFSVELRDKQPSYDVTLGAVVHLYNFLSITSSVEYRWLKFPDFYGVGSYRYQSISPSNVYEQNESFEATLGEAEGYFGIDILSYGPPPEYILHLLQRYTTAQLWWATHKPETFDLSGIGLKVGVRVEF